METINQRVSRCRKLAGFTQERAAEELGIKHSTYSQMERKGNISAQMVLSLAEIFNVHPYDILYSEEERPEPVNASPPSDPVPPPEPEIILTNLEQNIIKILRNIPKHEFDEIRALIEAKHKEYFCKKK